MSQRYNGNTKKPKPKQKNQLGILKMQAFCWIIQQRASGPGESTAGATYLSMRIHPKSCLKQPYLKVQGSVQLEYISHIAKDGVEATC